jgi:hypothetical protein
MRVWTDITGKHKIEVRFLSLTAGNVTLKTGTGQIAVPVDELSKADRDYLDELRKTIRSGRR